MKLVLASTNPGKLRELREWLERLGWKCELLDLSSFPDLAPVPEEGRSFLANALLKARTVSRHTGLPSLADDSGLEVEALGGGPGVFSARFSGPGASDEENNRLLLERLRGIPPPRRARYRAWLVLVVPGWGEAAAEGTAEGEILEHPRPGSGFGYDPLFFLPPLSKAFSELDPEERFLFSHRGRALRLLVSSLKEPAPWGSDPHCAVTQPLDTRGIVIKIIK